MSLGAEHRPLRDLVCDEIRDWITTGRLAPGDRLVEETIAHELGVSRNPVREAIRMLEWEGFVAVLPRRGAVVASLSPDEAEEILEVRIALQAQATRLAARKRSTEQLEQIFDVLARAERLLGASERPVAELSELDTEFHEIVLQMADNRFLAEFVRPLRHRIAWMFGPSREQRLEESWSEHRHMAVAIAAEDEERAATLAEQHIRRGRTGVTAAI